MFGLGQSPDLNPTVNTWSHIKLKLTVNCLKQLTLSGTTQTLLERKGEGYSMQSYFIYGICPIFAIFLTSDLNG